jgi:hypothetical protein
MQVNPSEFPPAEGRISLQGPAGVLETLTTTPSLESDITAVVCHPHPLYGGTMNNKVVYTVARAFNELGLRTVRFNFRGVGKSEGGYGEGIGETDDLLAVLSWVKRTRPNDRVWLAGFSFGSFVAARAAQQWPTDQLVSIAPPVTHFDFTGFQLPSCPWLIVQGDQDEIVSASEVFNRVRFSKKLFIQFSKSLGQFFSRYLITF